MREFQNPIEAGCPTPWKLFEREDGSIYVDDANGDVIYDSIGTYFPLGVMRAIIAYVNSCTEDLE
jgi:hypothetical protein